MPKKTSSTKYSREENTGFEKSIDSMDRDELKDLLMINTYKLALARAQIEAITEILIKNKITTYEDFWKRTNEIVKDNKKE